MPVSYRVGSRWTRLGALLLLATFSNGCASLEGAVIERDADAILALTSPDEHGRMRITKPIARARRVRNQVILQRIATLPWKACDCSPSCGVSVFRYGPRVTGLKEVLRKKSPLATVEKCVSASEELTYLTMGLTGDGLSLADTFDASFEFARSIVVPWVAKDLGLRCVEGSDPSDSYDPGYDKHSMECSVHRIPGSFTLDLPNNALPELTKEPHHPTHHHYNSRRGGGHAEFAIGLGRSFRAKDTSGNYEPFVTAVFSVSKYHEVREFLWALENRETGGLERYLDDSSSRATTALETYLSSGIMNAHSTIGVPHRIWAKCLVGLDTEKAGIRHDFMARKTLATCALARAALPGYRYAGGDTPFTMGAWKRLKPDDVWLTVADREVMEGLCSRVAHGMNQESDSAVANDIRGAYRTVNLLADRSFCSGTQEFERVVSSLAKRVRAIAEGGKRATRQRAQLEHAQAQRERQCKARCDSCTADSSSMTVKGEGCQTRQCEIGSCSTPAADLVVLCHQRLSAEGYVGAPPVPSCCRAYDHRTGSGVRAMAEACRSPCCASMTFR